MQFLPKEILTHVSQSLAKYQSVVEDIRLWRPKVGLILGTGMGGLANEIKCPIRIPYEQLPGFQPATIAGHQGELLAGWIHDRPVVALNGRSHFYEGRSLNDIQFPVLLLRELGVDLLIIGNASGGINPHYKSGQVMLIRDQLDLMFRNGRLTELPSDGCDGDSSHETGASYISRVVARRHSNPYSPEWIQIAEQIARERNLPIQLGTYAALTGPNYETRAEYRMLKILGADVVGMSTIPEANIACQMGLPVCGLSTITNVARPDVIESTTHDEVIAAVKSAENTLRILILELLRQVRTDE